MKTPLKRITTSTARLTPDELWSVFLAADDDRIVIEAIRNPNFPKDRIRGELPRLLEYEARNGLQISLVDCVRTMAALDAAVIEEPWMFELLELYLHAGTHRLDTTLKRLVRGVSHLNAPTSRQAVSDATPRLS